MKRRAALVDALALMPADDDDGADEPLRPEDVRHPQQQYTYQCIKHRAMQHLRGDGTADIGLPAPDWRILRSFKRDEALWQRAAPQLAAFKEACPLAAAAAGTKRKGAFQADGTEANKRAAGGDGGGGGGTSGGGGVGVGGGGGAFDLASTSVTKVDSAKPIETFWAMLKDQTEDRVTDALEQMARVVKDLFAAASSADDASATKAYACVRELRRASVQEEERRTTTTCRFAEDGVGRRPGRLLARAPRRRRAQGREDHGGRDRGLRGHRRAGRRVLARRGRRRRGRRGSGGDAARGDAGRGRVRRPGVKARARGRRLGVA